MILKKNNKKLTNTLKTNYQAKDFIIKINMIKIVKIYKKMKIV